MSPNYKKGGGDVACRATASPKKPATGRDTGRGGSSLVWLADARPRRVGENKRNKRAPTGNLVGHYYVVSRCPLINTAQPGPNKAVEG